MCMRIVMSRTRISSVLLFVACFLTTLAVTTRADAYERSYVRIKGTGPAVLYCTPGDLNSHIGILVMHPSGNFLDHATIVGSNGGKGLASLGYTVLALNSTMSSDDLLDTDKLLSQVGLGVKYLKDDTASLGVDTVILMGHSGGGPTMAAYQFIAENGVAACQGPEKIVPCPDSLAPTEDNPMDPADGLILLDSSPGFGAITLLSMDPAVANENKATVRIPGLDMYNEKNGFKPPIGWAGQDATYSSRFIKRYAAAQAKRMEKLIHTALKRLAVLNAGKGQYANDEPFDIPGCNVGKPQIWSLDLDLWHQTHNEQLLRHKDGEYTTEIVESNRGVWPQATAPAVNTDGGYLTTVRRFLNTWACRPKHGYGYDEDSVYGIDYHSTYNSPVAAVENITAPLLVVGMGAGQLLVSDETIYEHAVKAKHPDATLIFIEGATHGTTPLGNDYEKWGNTTSLTVETFDEWIQGDRPPY